MLTTAPEAGARAHEEGGALDLNTATETSALAADDLIDRDWASSSHPKAQANRKWKPYNHQSGQTHASATGSSSACTAQTLRVTCHSGGPGLQLSRSACPFCVPLPSAHGSEGLCRYGLSICRDGVFLTVTCSTAWLPWQHGRTDFAPVQLLVSYETAWRAGKIENNWSASLNATWSAVCSRTIVWYVILYISTLSRLLLARYTMTSLLSTPLRLYRWPPSTLLGP